MKVNVIDIDHKGNGIGRIDSKVVFIPKCIYGDCIDVDIVKSHKKYDEGIVKEILEPSVDRIESICPYYNICGGCNISNLNYYKQLEYKKNKVINIFKRYLDMDINPNIVGSDNRYEYRNKITFRCSDGKLGLVDIFNNVVNVSSCLLVSSRVNLLYKRICEQDLSRVKKVIIKECQNGLMLSVLGYIDIDNLKDMCLSIYIDNECVYKIDDGYIYIGDIKYMVSMDSFFQVNSCNIANLYDVLVKYGDFSLDDRVIDLYCGVGSIGLYIAKYVRGVLGIEIISDAIVDAKKNAEINDICNVDFVCGDVSKLIDDNIVGNKVIVDPPRTGLDSHTIDVLNKISIDKLIYVSCDPMTLVRDLKMLDKYEIKDITLVDMFPQTHHVESVVLLQKNDI